jgi:hypothetical protein
VDVTAAIPGIEKAGKVGAFSLSCHASLVLLQVVLYQATREIKDLTI